MQKCRYGDLTFVDVKTCYELQELKNAVMAQTHTHRPMGQNMEPRN